MLCYVKYNMNRFRFRERCLKEGDTRASRSLPSSIITKWKGGKNYELEIAKSCGGGGVGNLRRVCSDSWKSLLRCPFPPKRSLEFVPVYYEYSPCGDRGIRIVPP
jgi:hypothetical protein